jgi:hypothetical protein
MAWEGHGMCESALIDLVYNVREAEFVEAVSALLSLVLYQHLNRWTNFKS